MEEFFREFWKAARQGPRLFFAPLAGAINGVRVQWKVMENLNIED
jgi:hypothetical protein